MMNIADYPRPKSDNGRGVHWSTNLYHHAVTPSLDYWIDQLQAMKIKWVKVLDDGGGSALQLCRKLVAADMMPIVRIYLDELNPSTLGLRELETVSRLVDEGVFYFESNNEPDLPAEWSRPRPPNWKEVVIDNFIRDAERVIDRGGYLALPAMGPGSKINPIEIVVEKGRKDLFERGCWVAIHNYTLNHPLDYPDDEVNQHGRPLTQEEYDYYARWQYSDLSYDEIVAQGISLTRSDYDKYQRWAWDGRTKEMLNELRAANKNPGDTVLDDPNCFRGWEAAGKMIYDALGFYVPVISTEGGPVVGWGDDNRYAKANPAMQLDWQLDIVRFMQSRAAAWYFSCCTWLLASRPLSVIDPTWEQMSWYTHSWDQQFGLSGELPIVQALKDEPSIIRSDLKMGDGLVHGVVRGTGGDQVRGLALRLVGADRDIPRTTDEFGEFRFDGLAGGSYEILTRDIVLADNINLTDGAEKQVDITVAQGEQSIIEGVVMDAAGDPQRGMMVIVGMGPDQLETRRTTSDGRYRFEGLSPGSYWVTTDDASAAVAGIKLGGWNTETVNLTVPQAEGYRYRVITKRLLSPEETGNNRVFFGRVLNEQGEGVNGIEVEMAWSASAGTDFPRQITPRDRLKPAGNFDFLHSPGLFLVRVVEGDWPSDEATGLETANVPGREGDPISYEINFQIMPVGGEFGSGAISGVITNGAGLGLTLWLQAGGRSTRRSWAVILPGDGSYAFSNLPVGIYTIELEGQGVLEEVELAEGASETVNYEVEPVGPEAGSLTGTLSTHDGDPAVGQRILIYRQGVYVTEHTVDGTGQFYFEDLVPGSYRVDVGDVGTIAENIMVPSGETVTLTLTLPPVATGGTLAGMLLYADGQPAAGLLVSLSTSQGSNRATQTEDDGSFTFNGVEAGSYQLTVDHPQEGTVVLEDSLALDGETDVTVTYDDLSPVVSQERPLATYVLFGDRDDAVLLLELMQIHLGANDLNAGFRIDEAIQARTVVIVGGEEVVSETEQQMLVDAGCQVRRLPNDPFALVEVLDR